MKKALIIGASGFVGPYLAGQMIKDGWYVVATKMENERLNLKDAKVVDLDILKQQAVTDVLRNEVPDGIFHIAAQSSVAVSWKKPELTIDVNIKGCINVMEAARQTENRPRILMIGSSEEYGRIDSGESPVTEHNATRPGNIYAVTKVCQNMIGRIYVEAYAMDVLMTRSFNHMGPGQAPTFVIADFCKQVAEIEAGVREPVIYVGNLSAKRDFTDVRDIVRAYSLIMEKGKTGETYNVGSGCAIAIQTLLDKILSMTDKKIEIKVDSNRFRPLETPEITADISKLLGDTGWKQTFLTDETISDMLEYWRKAITDDKNAEGTIRIS